MYYPVKKLLFGIVSLLFFSACTSEDLPTENNANKQETTMFEKITALKAQDLIAQNKDNEDFIILDVRTPDEFATGHLKHAVNLDFYNENFKSDLERLNKSKIYLIYCRTGMRSGGAVEMMEEFDFQTVYDMGGITTWIGKNYPVVQ